ncbi:MAG: ABC transporter substrate-binding protein [bacterium]
MKIPYHLLIVSIIALAGCGSTRNASTYRPAPVESDTSIIPKVVIPKEAPPIEIEEEKNYRYETEPLKISLLLPLNIKSGQYRMADVIADYYEGILLGIDSLQNMGISIELNVFDTKSDSATVKKLTWKQELQESDVIIGPTFKQGHAILLPFAKARKIALVSPFSNANMWSDSNHYALYCTPDENAFTTALANTISEKYPNAKLILFNDNTKDDKDFIWRFKVAARKLDISNWVDITYKSGWNIEPHLKKSDSALNIIIAPTDNARVALQLITQLKDPEINNILFVRDSWLSFNNVGYQSYLLWEQNNLHVLSHYFVDQHEKTVMRFKGLYKEKYSSIPDEFAYRGFDHILAIGNAYMKTLEDESVADVIPKNKFQGLHNNFNFEFNGKALENQSVNVMRFTNYRFLRVK